MSRRVSGAAPREAGDSARLFVAYTPRSVRAENSVDGRDSLTGRSLQAATRRSAATLFGCRWPVLAALAALVPFVRGFSTTNVFSFATWDCSSGPGTSGSGRHCANGRAALGSQRGGGTVGRSGRAESLLPAARDHRRVLAPPVRIQLLDRGAAPPILAVGTACGCAAVLAARPPRPAAQSRHLPGRSFSAGDFPNLSWTIAAIP